MVAGEASGDFLGAHLIAALRREIPALRVVGIGGPKMEAQGLDSWFPMEKLAVRGYAEAFRRHRRSRFQPGTRAQAEASGHSGGALREPVALGLARRTHVCDRR